VDSQGVDGPYLNPCQVFENSYPTRLLMTKNKTIYIIVKTVKSNFHYRWVCAKT